MANVEVRFLEEDKGKTACATLQLTFTDLPNNVNDRLHKSLSRQGFVQAIIDIIREICERELQRGTGRFPFVFFEEAHLYISHNTIGYIVTRSRHLGITCFFVTNMISGLDETVLRQGDNLFLLYLPFDDDVRHIIKSAITGQETMGPFWK